MPLPDRSLPARGAHGVPGRPEELFRRALQVLLDDSLAHVVGLVAWRSGDLVHVADSTGETTVAADGATVVLRGVDPLGDPDPLSDRGFPFAAVRLHSLFAERRAPDLAVVHTDGHHWPERGGHLGEHGSLGAVQ